MKKYLTFPLINIFAMLLGVTLTLAFAPFEIFPFAILAPAGLLALWLKASPRRAFGLGFWFGIGFFGTGVYWVYISVNQFGGVPPIGAAAFTGAFVAILALFPACTGYALNRYFPPVNTVKMVYAFPAIWVAVDIIRGNIFTGFPWLFIGYSQSSSPLKGYAAILSVYAVTLAALLTSGLLVNAYMKYRQKMYQLMYYNLLAIVILWIGGSLLCLIPWTKPEGKPVTVSLVQGNIPQSLKWSPEHLALSFDTYEKLTAPLWGKSQLIVWPEAAIPVSFEDATSFLDSMTDKAKQSGSELILGIPQSAGNDSYYNSLIALGTSQQVYQKRRLVPFGEYTPLANISSQLLKFMDIPMSNLISGAAHQPPMQIGDLKILPSICYEIAFPDLMQTPDKSISFLLVVTNDAWFGRSSAQAQHLQMAKMRALELGRAVLFVSNDGITAIIGPDGRIEASIPPHEAAVLTSTVQPMFGLTPWMRNGIDSVWFVLICILFIAIRANKTAGKMPEKNMAAQEIK